MTNEHFAKEMYEIMLEVISDDQGYKPFTLKRVVERRGRPAIANVKGDIYLLASFANLFISLDPGEIEYHWYHDERIDAFDTNPMGAVLKKNKRIYDLGSRPVYLLNKESLKRYFGEFEEESE